MPNKTKKEKQTKYIFNAEGSQIKADNIHPYLIDFPNVFLGNRTSPICTAPKMLMGNMPNDNKGCLSNISTQQKNEIVAKYPYSEKLFRRIWGAEEFVHNNERWCLWLKDINPVEYIDIKPITEAIEKVKKAREKSTRSGTRKAANTPMLFGEIRQPDNGSYLLIPRHTTGLRNYIPMDFERYDVITTDANVFIPNATIYHFGVLTSIVHMAWIQIVCGRIKSDFRYSVEGYNNFPWPKENEVQKLKIEKTAQAIIDVRRKYSNCTFLQLYGENDYLFTDLVAAHKANDRAVMEAYGFAEGMSNEAIVGELLKMYEKLTANQPETKTKGRKKAK